MNPGMDPETFEQFIEQLRRYVRERLIPAEEEVIAQDRIPDDILAEMREISHCYERECPPGWHYNLFTMIHARSEEELRNIVADIGERFKFNGFKIFRTEKELKKTSMRYFEETQP